MKKSLLILLCAMLMSMNVYAAGWILNDDTWFYKEDDGNFAISKWITYDSDNDGKKEYFYLNEAGALLVSTITPDGYQVNENGQWVENGIVKCEEKANAIILEPTVEVVETVERIDNTEGVDPNMIPPKVQQAIDKIMFWCNENGEIIIPYSKKEIRFLLETAGFKQDVRNRAISEAKVDWNNHALIFAKSYASVLSKSLKGNELNKKIRDLLKFEMFTSDEIKYAIENINGNVMKDVINPLDYEGLTREEKIQKLKLLGLTDEKVEEALNFLQSIN